MYFHRIIRFFAAIIALLCVAITLLCGINLRKERSQLQQLKAAIPAYFTADLTVSGKSSFIFQHTTPLYSHGCIIYIKTPAGLDRQKLINELNNASINIRLHSNERTLAAIKNAVVTSQAQLVSFLPSQYHPKYIPFIYLDLANTHLISPGAYLLEYDVTNPATAPELKNCSFIVKYGWCALEKREYYVSLSSSLSASSFLCSFYVLL